MTQRPDVFEFVSYKVCSDKKTIDFNYKINPLSLTEKIILPDEIPTSFEDKLVNKVL